MLPDALTAVLVRNQFYRTGQRRTLLILLISLLTNVLLATMLGWLILNPPAPQYFPTNLTGHIVRLFPYDQPNQSDEAVLQWSGLAAVAAFSYNFVNYRQELQSSSDFFTGDGWQRFLKALGASNNLDALRVKKFIVSAVATSPPKIVSKGVSHGRYVWKIQVPLLVTYQNNTEYALQHNLVTMIVIRVSTLNAPRGIGIAQFVVSPLVEE